MKQATSPDAAAEQILRIVDGDSWQVRYPIGPTAPRAIAWRARTKDEGAAVPRPGRR
jgi:hypothetical protein